VQIKGDVITLLVKRNELSVNPIINSNAASSHKYITTDDTIVSSTYKIILLPGGHCRFEE
jgi:hypothetical protein